MLDKVKKILTVVFLTLMIWMWAYSATEATITVSGTISISETKGLLVDFEDIASPVRIKFDLKGPKSKVDSFEKQLTKENKGKDLQSFYYDVVAKGMAAAGGHELNVLDFLQSDPGIKDWGLTVEKCEVVTREGQDAKIQVEVQELVEQPLGIKCLSASDNTLREHETIKPSIINMYVQKGFDGTAFVSLSQREIERARDGGVNVKPYVKFSSGKSVYADSTVLVELPSAESSLQPVTFQLKRFGFIISPEMLEKYDIQLEDPRSLKSATVIRTSPEAQYAYENMKTQVLIEVFNNDEPGEAISRDVIYNFPPEYVSTGQIEGPAVPATAKFILIPKEELLPGI